MSCSPAEVALNEDKLAHVSPRVGGAVREVKKRLGDVVKKGDVLAILDSKELAELSGQARAAFERLKLAKSNFERVDKLYQDKIVPEKEHLASKKELAEAQIDVESTSQMLASAGTGTAGRYNLVAPLDGTIIEKHASVGEVLKDDTRVFVIADLSTVWVDITVYAKDLAKVGVGQSVTVRADGLERPIIGTISFVGAIARTDARAAQARVVLPNPDGRLKPGLFVTAAVGVERSRRAWSSRTTPSRSWTASVVFVEEGGEFEARKVRTGRTGARRGEPGCSSRSCRASSPARRSSTRGRSSSRRSSARARPGTSTEGH
ncbi:MAG: efflux RND transporter periplasmic adaptor subunit [Polyangiaceae bacterium]|nr:efflux RND transporter periplasmic adaptor subunit [Polyangiaceae bacterium]